MHCVVALEQYISKVIRSVYSRSIKTNMYLGMLFS